MLIDVGDIINGDIFPSWAFGANIDFSVGSTIKLNCCMREIWNELSLIYMQSNNKTGYRHRKNLIHLIHEDEQAGNQEKISKFKFLSGRNISFEHLNGCSYERGRDRVPQTRPFIGLDISVT